VSFDLEPPPDDELENRMADLASIVRILNPEPYESDGDALFALLVRGLSLYVTAWANSDVGRSLAGVALTAEDLADPDRANDPNAAFTTLLDLTLEAIFDNIAYELGNDNGRG